MPKAATRARENDPVTRCSLAVLDSTVDGHTSAENRSGSITIKVLRDGGYVVDVGNNVLREGAVDIESTQLGIRAVYRTVCQLINFREKISHTLFATLSALFAVETTISQPLDSDLECNY